MRSSDSRVTAHRGPAISVRTSLSGFEVLGSPVLITRVLPWPRMTTR